ncbi:transposase InsO family protein [Acetobacter oeni]|nr:transposase InsO family protein [Acetobacter oeni]
MNNPAKKFLPGVRTRAVWLVPEHEREHPSRRAVMVSISEKIGCSAHRLNERVRKGEVATWPGFVCIAFVIDVFAPSVVDWRVSRTAHAGFVLNAPEQAVHARPMPVRRL